MRKWVPSKGSAAWVPDIPLVPVCPRAGSQEGVLPTLLGSYKHSLSQNSCSQHRVNNRCKVSSHPCVAFAAISPASVSNIWLERV